MRCRQTGHLDAAMIQKLRWCHGGWIPRRVDRLGTDYFEVFYIEYFYSIL